MKRLYVVLLVIIAALSIIVATAMYLSTSPFIFNIHGVVNVGDENVSAKVINVSVEIKTPSGTEVFENIATVTIPKNTSYIVFKTVSSNVSGKIRLLLNGRIILVPINNGTKHVVDMPCLLSVNETCYRPQMIIPGYDKPLKVEPGTYNVSLILSWRASGRGKFNLSIGMVMLSGREAMIIPIGTNPVNTTNWILAENSTRTYALLIDKDKIVPDENGYGVVKAWAWMFAPSNGDDTVVFTFKVVNRGFGIPIYMAKIPVEKQGAYYQVLLMIKLRPGVYIFSVEYPNGARLEVPIEVLADTVHRHQNNENSQNIIHE